MAHPDASAARERRVITAGASVVMVALALTYGVMPFVGHWRAREAALDAARARVAYLGDLASRTSALEAAAAEAERAVSSQRRRVLHARSSTLAASALQAYLQDAADASHVVVTRLEVSPDDSSASDRASDTPADGGSSTSVGVGSGVGSGGATRLPATLAAYGDITGAATLLNVLMTGPRAVFIERLSLSRNAALLGAPDVVQVTVTMRMPVLPP